MKCKILSAYTKDAMETAINNWLSDNSSVTVDHITMSFFHKIITIILYTE